MAILPVSKDKISLQGVYVNLNWSSCTIIQTHDAFYILFRCIIQLFHIVESLQWNAAQHAAVSSTAPFVTFPPNFPIMGSLWRMCHSQVKVRPAVCTLKIKCQDNAWLDWKINICWGGRIRVGHWWDLFRVRAAKLPGHYYIPRDSFFFFLSSRHARFT